MNRDANKMVLFAAIWTLALGFIGAFAGTPDRRQKIGKRVVTVKGKEGGMPTMRFIIGWGMMMMFLSAMADLSPKVAKPMAALIMTSAVFIEGKPVLDYISQTFAVDKPLPSGPIHEGPFDATSNAVTQTDRVVKSHSKVKAQRIKGLPPATATNYGGF